MAEDKKVETELIRLDALTLWGEKGNISVSIKNGYPRFTFFFKGEKGKFLSAPMDIKTFGVVGTLIKRVAKSKEDLKYSIQCYNKDYNTQEKILQSILVIAKIDKDIYLGIKKDQSTPANLTKIEKSQYIEISENDELPSDDLQITELAVTYADLIFGAILNYKSSNDNIPNSARANTSSKPTGTPNSDEYSNSGL
jgi:hypothetical protein